MKKHIRTVMFLLILSASLSAMAVVNRIDSRKDASPCREIWLKLWEHEGRVIDMRFRIDSAAASRISDNGAIPLTTYPFQFDISDLGEIPVENVRGIVYGYKILPDGRPGAPLMVRWWVARQDQLRRNEPAASLYPLTLKLRVWDEEGNEFDPEKQQAALFQRSSVLCESAQVRPLI